jgi:hypothetical protein
MKHLEPETNFFEVSPVCDPVTRAQSQHVATMTNFEKGVAWLKIRLETLVLLN